MREQWDIAIIIHFHRFFNSILNAFHLLLLMLTFLLLLMQANNDFEIAEGDYDFADVQRYLTL